jgi:hypothetical protein
MELGLVPVKGIIWDGQQLQRNVGNRVSIVLDNGRLCIQFLEGLGLSEKYSQWPQELF